MVSAHPDLQSLVNPILPAPAADPWVIEHGGVWFALLAVEGTLQLRAAAQLSELRFAKPVTIWRAPRTGPYSRSG